MNTKTELKSSSDKPAAGLSTKLPTEPSAGQTAIKATISDLHQFYDGFRYRCSFVLTSMERMICDDDE